MNELTTQEAVDLGHYEAIIDRGLTTFREVGEALMAIREARLYRADYQTFEDYCQQRWGMTKTHANRLVQSAETLMNLTPIGAILPSTESQARPLTALEPDQQREAWRRVIESTPPDQITAKVVLQAAQAIRKEQRASVRDETPPPSPLPNGKYRIIYADPPWQYQNTMPEYFKEQADHYPLMTIQQISELPIKDIAEKDSVLFMWATSPILPEALDVVKAWGFEYKAAFVWDKVIHVMGHYNSVRHEFLLICVRGSCQPDVKKLFDSVVTVERDRHSEKPEVFREIIDTLYPYGQRVELFARRKVNGWSSYGNQLS
jgi:N6-adenosine-specific RNA methylase IME4